MSEDLAVGAENGGQSQPEKMSAGTLLRTAREAAGLHVAALAVSMKVPVRKLEALEADRWDLLPDAVFVRALASSVCRTLKIDPAPVLRQLPQLSTPRLDAEERGINTPFHSAHQGSGSSAAALFSRPSVIVVLLLLAAAMAVLFVPEIHFPSLGSSAAVEPVAPAPAEMASAPPVLPAVIDPPHEDTTSPADAQPAAAVSTPASALAPVAVATPASARAPVVAVTPAPTAVVSASAAPSAKAITDGVLVFHAKDDTWVEVLDANKVVLARRILKAGETAGFGGDLPLSVVVGRVDSVTVEIRGKAYAMDAIGTTNVARFEVK